MKKLVVLLIVLVLSVWGGLHMAAAQEGTNLKALSLGPVSVVTAPGGTEVVAELAEYTQVTVLRTDETGAWLEVETADALTGFAPIESFMILNLPPLAPKGYVSTNRTGVTALYVEPNITAEFSTTLPDGTIGTILGTHGAEWSYVATAQGTGWSIATDWEMLPEGAKPALVETVRVEQIGIYAEPNLTADIATTIANGTLLYWLGEPDGEFVEVLLPDASTGYALTTDFVDVPSATVVSETGRNGTAAIYAEANFEGEIVTTLEDGVACALLSAVDDYWIEVYNPTFGKGFALKNNFSNVFTVATVRTQDAIMRDGPNDNVYTAVATLDLGSKVIVKGVDKDGAWIQVAVPFSEVDWPRNGVQGWMRDYLFEDAEGNKDFDQGLLAVTSEE